MKSDVGQRGKLLLSSFIEFLRVRVCGHAASLLFCVSKGTRLGLHRYM